MKEQKEKELTGKQAIIALALVIGGILSLSNADSSEITLSFIIGILLIIVATIYTVLCTEIE